MTRESCAVEMRNAILRNYLNPSLPFDSAEFLSRRLDGRFERTLSVLSSRLRVSYWSEVQLLSDLDTLIYCLSTKATLRGLTLFRFARRGGRTTFNRQSGCCEIRCSRPPEARHFRRFVLRNGAGFRWAADSSSSSACKAK